MSKQTYSVCFCCRRRFKLAMAEAPPEIKTLFEKYSENELMTASQLQRFLLEVQGQQNATQEEAQSIIDSLKHFHRKGLNLESFFKYLFSDTNLPLPPSIEVNIISFFAFSYLTFCFHSLESTSSRFGVIYFPIGVFFLLECRFIPSCLFCFV